MRSPQTNLREREYQNSSKRFGRVTLEKAGLHALLFFREGRAEKTWFVAVDQSTAFGTNSVPSFRGYYFRKQKNSYRTVDTE